MASVFTVAACLIFAFPRQTESSKCENLASLAALKDHNTVVETNSKLLTGTWMSEGCETRPGPEFVLRAYNFDEDGSFLLYQHHYWDDSCSSPQLTVVAHGKLLMRNSLLQPGAASGNVKLSNITVIPQDTNAAKELDRTVSMECPGQYWKSWRRYEEHTVYDAKRDDKKKTHNLWKHVYDDGNTASSVNSNGNNVQFSDISCLGSLKWAFNELKLLKIQLRPLLDGTKRRQKEAKMELLLGDIHTNYRVRQFYNPTSFQVPLLKQGKDETVFVNRHSYVLKTPNAIPTNIFSGGKTPPHLIEKPHLPLYVWGEWTSVRCESRPMGLYLTRRFSFYPEDQMWIGDHQFYSDPFCKIPKFIVTAAGHFSIQGANKEIKGTSDINFQIEKASLTVLDEKMIYDMGLPGLCGTGEWEVNVPKELSSTNGCVQLGILLPSVQYDIVKLEMDYKGSFLLYFGQVNTDQLHEPTVNFDRPTAFQSPLVKCGEMPAYSQSLRDILGENSFYSGSDGHRIGFVPFVVVFFVIFC